MSARRQLLAILVGVVIVGAALADDDKEKETAATLTLPKAQARVKAIEQNKDLADAAKQAIVGEYQLLIEKLKEAEDWASKASRHKAAIERAPQLIADAKGKLSQPVAESVPAPEEKTPLAELVKQYEQTRREMIERRKQAAEKENEPGRRAARRVEIPKLHTAAKARLEELRKQLETKAPDQSDEVAFVKRATAHARVRAVEMEIQAYASEWALYEATGELVRLQLDLLKREIALFDKQVAVLRDVVADRRKKEATEQQEKAEREAAGAHPAVKEIANGNAQLASLRVDLASRLEIIARETERTGKELGRVNEQFSRIKQRVETAGSGSAIHMLLRKQSREIPDVYPRERNLAKRKGEIAKVQLELLDRETEREDLSDVEDRVRQAMLAVGVVEDEFHERWIKHALSEALNARREILDSVLTDQQKYFERLIELDTVESRLVAAAHKLEEYVAERLLWIQSGKPLELADMGRAASAGGWLFSPTSWKGLVADFGSDAKANPSLYAGAGLAAFILFLYQQRLRRILRRIGEAVSKSYTDTFAETLVALGITVAISAYWPAIVYFASWRIHQFADASDFSKSLAFGLQAAAGVMLITQFFRQICRPGGVADAHFRWKAQALARYRWSLYWLSFTESTLLFLIVAMRDSRDDLRHHSLGRLAFLASMAILSVFIYMRIRRTDSTEGEKGEGPLGTWMMSLRFLWFPAATLAPIGLGITAAMGYYDTALKLSRRLALSVVLVALLVVLHSLLQRWFFALRGKFAMRLAKDRKDAAEAEGDRPLDEPILNLSIINIQTRQLLKSVVGFGLVIGLTAIWMDVLPALGFLERVTIWSYSTPMARTVQDADGAVRTVREDIVTAVTLANALAATFTLLMTLAAARNLPGFLEISILRRVPLDGGGRYAIATLVRYVVTLVGVTLAAWCVGVGWSNVQWLAAAFTVGLGFGLQEIFANFVSGIILLFERPMRVGDLVSVGDMTGVVTRIRIRATTMIDRTKKELIIPNKEFITGRLVNWTLTDRSHRSSMSVGVAYGTDVAKVVDVLTRLVKSHPLVLEEATTPSVTVEEFAASSINLCVTFSVMNVDDLKRVKHELLVAIDRTLREESIEIAFPQCDVHVRSIDAPAAIADAIAKSIPITARQAS